MNNQVAGWGKSPEEALAMLPKGTRIYPPPHLVEGRLSDPFGKAFGPLYLVTGYLPEGDPNAGIGRAQAKTTLTEDIHFTYIDPSYVIWSDKEPADAQPSSVQPN